MMVELSVQVGKCVHQAEKVNWDHMHREGGGVMCVSV